MCDHVCCPGLSPTSVFSFGYLVVYKQVAERVSEYSYQPLWPLTDNIMQVVTLNAISPKYSVVCLCAVKVELPGFEFVVINMW